MSLKRLGFHPLASATTIARPGYEESKQVDMDSPALSVMTDLTHVKAITTQPHVSLHEVNQHMIHTGVRLVLVTDSRRHVIGVLTASDLLGSRPMEVVAEQRIPHNELRVEHIMTPQDQVQVLLYRDVQRADVREVVDLLRDAARQHALVAEPTAEGPRVRGIFSMSQIERQLGVHLEPTGAAHNFLELERQLAG